MAIFSTFQNAGILRTLAGFSSLSLHRASVMGFLSRFSHILGNFNSSPKLTNLQRLLPLRNGQFFHFSKGGHFSKTSCVFAWKKFILVLEFRNAR